MRKYTQLDGFTATSAYIINQDTKGYLWIGTDNGGMGFDGHRFSALQQAPRGAHMEITTCIPLSHQRIILCPLTGHELIRNQDTISREHLYINPMAKHNFVVQDAISNSWWIYDADLDTDQQAGFCVYSKDGIRQHTLKEKGLIALLVLDSQLIGVKDLLLKVYDLKTDQCRVLRHQDGTVLNSNEEPPVHMTETVGYLLTHHIKQNRINVYRYIPGDTILKMCHSFPAPFRATIPYSGLSYRKRQYLFMKDANSGRIAYCPDVASPGVGSISFTISENANSLFVDRNNNLWISSSGNALYFLSGNHVRNAFAAQGLPSGPGIARCVSGDKEGALYISYLHSRQLIISNKGKLTRVLLNNSFCEGSRNILPVDSTTFLIYNKDMALVDKNTGSVRYCHLRNYDYKDVCRYRTGEFLTATHSCILHVRLSDKGICSFTRVFSGRCSAVELLGDGRILIGTAAGLYVKPGLQAAATLLKHPLLTNTYIADIVPLANNGALIGTNGNGLLLYRQDGSVQQIRLQDSSSVFSIRQLFTENDTVIWAATSTGGNRIVFDARGGLRETSYYTFYDGLPSNNVTAIYVRNDTAFFATAEGWGVIPVRDRNRLLMPAPVLSMNWLRAGDIRYANPDHKIVVPYARNDLQLSLSGISYESQEKVTYYYRLFPMQQDWIPTADPEIRLNNVDPGEYSFEAYATNAKGIKSDTLRLLITIEEAYWQTLYFRLAVMLLAGTAFYFLLRWRIRKTEREKYRKEAQKKHLAQLELEAIKAQINPHFIHNCLNSIQYLNYKEDYGNAQKYLVLFARLIRKTMKYAQRTFISVAEEAEYLSQYLELEKLRFKEQFNYRIEMDKNLPQDTLLPAMLLQPYAENALKHGITPKEEAGDVRISFRKEGTVLQITIADNGPGFVAAGKEDTLGLRLSGSRAQSYNDLFGLDITISRHNIQETEAGSTGAIVTINIDTTSYEKGKK